ncbi:MAG: hypothetical protein U0559_00365 [Anaerolineae bacterium]
MLADFGSRAANSASVRRSIFGVSIAIGFSLQPIAIPALDGHIAARVNHELSALSPPPLIVASFSDSMLKRLMGVESSTA